MDPFLGQIQAFGFNFAPRGWAKCEGQLLPISQNSALFSLLGTTYGGDGRTTFGLPDLRGRTPMSAGHGPGLTSRTQGAKSGTEHNTLQLTNLPNIPVRVSSGNSTQNAATAGASIATPGTTAGRSFTATQGFNAASPDIALNGGTAGGNSTPVNNMQPFTVVNYCIALQGIFPSRN